MRKSQESSEVDAWTNRDRTFGNIAPSNGRVPRQTKSTITPIIWVGAVVVFAVWAAQAMIRSV